MLETRCIAEMNGNGKIAENAKKMLRNLFVSCSRPKMVQFKLFLILMFFTSQSATSSDQVPDQVDEGSKKIVLVAKKAQHGKQFHCDLSLLPAQKRLMYYSAKSDGAMDLYNWPKNKEGKVIVPYVISKASHYTDDQMRLIRYSMDEIERVTCIRFQPRKHAVDYVNIYSGRFCRSNLGRTGGPQELSLNWKTCFDKGIIIHELMHALGYIHMHNRPDRDKYVKIMWKNIDPKWYKEFEKVSPSNFNYLGTPYDYQSIMHYSAGAFSKNGGMTIITKNSESIGQRYGLSDGDINRINTKYHCHVDTPSFIDSSFHQPEYSLSSGHHSISSSSLDFFNKPEYSFKPSESFTSSLGFQPSLGFKSSSYKSTSYKSTDPDDDDLFNI